MNQLAVNVYVRVLHGGDPHFITRHLGRGWFHLATNAPSTVAVAALLGPRGAALLAPSILRVQAFLELPFVLYAYLSIARSLDVALYRQLTRVWMLALASVSFTVAFAGAELALPNPFTRDDLVMRAVACLLVPIWIAWTARSEAPADDPRRPAGVVGLILFAAGAIGTALVVLAMYDVALVYNNAHLDARLNVLAVGSALASLAHLGAGRVDALAARIVSGDPRAPAPRPSLAVRAAVESLAAFTLVFFVPSLPLRYSGGALAACVLGAVLVGAGAIAGATRAIRQARPHPSEVAAAGIGAALGLGCALAAAATDLGGLLRMRDPMPEHLLLRKAALVLVFGVLGWRAAEAALLVAWRAATGARPVLTSADPPRP